MNFPAQLFELVIFEQKRKIVRKSGQNDTAHATYNFDHIDTVLACIFCQSITTHDH